MTNPRTLSPDRARTLAARCIDDAMEALDVSNCALARHLGCDEKIVRRLRSGESPLTGEVILRLPPKLRGEVLRRLSSTDNADDFQHCGHALIKASADVISAATECLANGGGIDATERAQKMAPVLAVFDHIAAPLRATREEG